MGIKVRTNASEGKKQQQKTLQTKLALAYCFFDNTILVACKSHTTIKGTWNPRKKFVLVIAEAF